MTLKTLSADGNAKLESLLIHNEKFRAFPYDDKTGLAVTAPEGNITWGIGINVTAGLELPLALIIMRYSLTILEDELLKYTHWFAELSEIRKIVIFDAGFNLGVKRLLTFKDMCAALEDKNFVAASAAMVNSKWHEEVGQRAINDEIMMRENTWIEPAVSAIPLL